MKKVYYSFYKLSELEFNVGYSSVCESIKRVSCDKNKKCGIQLCGMDKEKIGKIAGVKKRVLIGTSDFNRYEQIENAVDLWRKLKRKQCKGFEVIIQRSRGGK